MNINARGRFCLLVFLLITVSNHAISKQRTFLRDASSVYSSREKSIPDKIKGILEQASITSVSSLSSTVVFEENFEGESGFPPLGWQTVNADGGGTVGPWFQGNTSIFTAYNGNGYAAANYQGANDFYIDEWLISPQILSVGLNDTLTFWHRSPDYSAWDDSIEIRISTTDTAITSFTIKVDYFKTSTSGWTQNQYPLKNYVTSGSDIYIAFRYLIYDGGISGLSSDYAGIDLVQIVRPQVERDIKVASIDYPSNGSKILISETITPSVTYENAGSITQSNIPLRLNIIPPSGNDYEDSDTIQTLAPGQSIQIVFNNFSPNSTGVHTVKAYSLLSTDQNTINDSLTSSFREAVLISGIFTVGDGVMIPTLKAAVDTLNNNIISGDVTFSLISSEYNEPPLSIGPLDYSFLINLITFEPAVGVNPIININSTSSEPFGLAIMGSSNVILNGSIPNENTTNMTISANGINGKIGILIRGVEGAFADSNEVRNLNIRNGADSLLNSDEYYGVLLYGYNETYHDAGNIVYNCDIQKHGSTGIAVQWQDGAIIENNNIHNWVQKGEGNDIHGIWLADGATNTIVRNNVIGDIITKVNYSWAYGIENGAGTGSNVLVYNNMIYNVASTGGGTDANFSRAIYGSSILNSGDSYYYNSIYLSGIDSSTHSSSRTAGFEFVGGSNITLINNIVFNEFSLLGSSSENKSYCVYLSTIPTNFISDHNDFYAPGLQGIIGYNSGNRATLSDWRSSFSPAQDEASISANPLFVSASTGNLHIQTGISSPANAAGTPVEGISIDIDGMSRHQSSPDIGADEFIPGASMISITYNEGWNLVSVPLIVDDYQKTSLFPTAVSEAFSFHGTYIVEAVLSNSSGYWLKFDSPRIVEMAGSPLFVDTVDVVEGWNLIGSLSDTIATASIIQVPGGIIASKYYYYNGIYAEAVSILPGKGYWVKSKQGGKLVLRQE